MTTTWYLILISALALVAGLMLYAKFASLYRKKQSNLEDREENAEVDFTPSVISAANTETEALEEIDEIEEDESRELVMESDHSHEVEAESRSLVQVGTVDAIPHGEERNAPAEEYYDDLQEAAAGLAMLMRSSSTSGAASAQRFVVEPEEGQEIGAAVEGEISGTVIPPVGTAQIRVDSVEMVEEVDVLDAEITEEDAVESLEEDTVSGEVVEEEVTDGEFTQEESPEEVDAVAELQEVEAEAVVEEEVELSEEPAPEVISAPSIVSVLGEEVSGRIEKIDSGLDALEELVASIEASLASFTPLTDEEDTVESQDGQGESVSEAA